MDKPIQKRDCNGYSCKYCTRQYIEKFNYDRHIVCCEFFHKSNRERNEDIDLSDTLPTQREMYQLMQDLVIRVNKLEKENAKLKQVQKRKFNILDRLNDPLCTVTQSTTLSKWITNIVLPDVHKHLNTVFHSDLLSGINGLFEQVLSAADLETIPICAFDNIANTFYAFQSANGDDDPKWTKLSPSDLNKQLHIVAHRFAVDFKTHWYEVNKDKMETDESYKDKYINYYKNILGGDRMSDETRYQRVRQKIYSLIKQSVKMTEYVIE